MSRKRQAQAWDSTDRALMELYGINLDKPEASTPKFGSHTHLLLTVGGETKLMEPTYHNLACHFGYTDWLENNIKSLVQKSKGRVQASDLDKRLIMGGLSYSRDIFESQRIKRIRTALLNWPHPLNFYCVPSVSIETETVTGQPLITEGDRVLCILPPSVEIAQHYRLSEPEIQLLASQAMWLVKLLCGLRIIRTSDQLNKAIDGWPAYLNPTVVEKIQENIRQTNPQLVPPAATQALLPGV
jgi:hypothetical protein